MAAGWTATGCQWLVDADIAQCEADVDCAAFGANYTCGPANVCVFAPMDIGPMSPDAGAPLPVRWACLEQPPEPVMSSEGTVLVRFSVFNYAGFTVPEDVLVKACNVFDVSCTAPLLEDVPLDAEGFASLELPKGFNGYFEVTGPTIVDSLLYRNRPFLTDEEFEGPAVVSPEIRAALAEGGGEMVDTSQGIIIIDVKDCDGVAAPGVTFAQEDTTSEESPFYFVGALPDRDRPSTIPSMMLTSDGTPRSAGGFSMVDRGYVTVLGVLEDGGALVGRVTVTVRPGVMSFAQIFAGY